MPNISDMNIVLGQASAIKQMQPIPPLSAEHNAQLAAQAAAVLQKREQERVRQVKAGQEAELKKQDKHAACENNETSRPSPGSFESDTGRIVDIKI
jgi:hypothetical protein